MGLGAALIVDDAPEMTELLSNILLHLGFDPEICLDNRIAFDVAVRCRPVLITTDRYGPGSGIDFVAQVRRTTELRTVPIVMISGGATEQDELLAWRAGITGFLKKPFGISELIDIIHAALHKNSNPDYALLQLGVEGRDLDYKQELQLDSNVGRAEFARDVIAMANAGGGQLIIGVAEQNGKFVHVGVPDIELFRYETTRLNDSVRKYVSGTVAISARQVAWKQMVFVFIKVLPADDTIALAASSHDKAGLFTGRIYIRTQDGRTAELCDALELRRMIDRLVDRRCRAMPSRGR